MKQIAVKISDQSHDRLQRLAHQGKTNYATIVEAAIMAYQPLTSETIYTNHDLKSLIEAALGPVLARVAALESMGLVKPLNPENSVMVSVEASHQSGDLGASESQGIVEAVADRIAAEIAPVADKGKPTIKAFIAHLVASSERSPTKIANALNQAGYRTQTKTEFQRSNPQIKAALDAVKGEA